MDVYKLNNLPLPELQKLQRLLEIEVKTLEAREEKERLEEEKKRLEESKKSLKESKKWECSRCTFLNKKINLACRMCNQNAHEIHSNFSFSEKNADDTSQTDRNEYQVTMKSHSSQKVDKATIPNVKKQANIKAIPKNKSLSLAENDQELSLPDEKGSVVTKTRHTRLCSQKVDMATNLNVKKRTIEKVVSKQKTPKESPLTRIKPIVKKEANEEVAPKKKTLASASSNVSISVRKKSSVSRKRQRSQKSDIAIEPTVKKQAREATIPIKNKLRKGDYVIAQWSGKTPGYLPGTCWYKAVVSNVHKVNCQTFSIDYNDTFL